MIDGHSRQPRPIIEHTIQYDDGTFIAPLGDPHRLTDVEKASHLQALADALDPADSDIRQHETECSLSDNQRESEEKASQSYSGDVE